LKRLPWVAWAWFGALLLLSYAPVLWRLAGQWDSDPDMGHGFFVPLVVGFIVWQKRAELLALPPAPNWWGLAVVLYAGLQLWIATLGAELFLARTAFVISLIGVVLLLGGTAWVRALAFPLFLLFFMIPIPTVVYNSITFPLQLLASRLSTQALDWMQIPVLREGNVLELAEQKLSVV
jgi:exosortase